MKKKFTLKDIVKNLDAIVTCTTLALCVILVNCNVIMRYFFNNPIKWSEEVVTSLFVWTVFICRLSDTNLTRHLLIRR